MLGQLNLVISKLFLQQVFKHPGQAVLSTGNTMHWGSPLGIGELKTYFLVYKVLIVGLFSSSLISLVLADWLDVLHSDPIDCYLFVVTPGTTQT